MATEVIQSLKYIGYGADVDGVCYSFKRGKEWRRFGRVNRQGYMALCVHLNGKKSFINAHQLVADVFVPNPHKLPMIRHLNGIKTDNNPSNLAWGTDKDNKHDSMRLGVWTRGEGCKKKLTEKKVRVIKHALTIGVKPTLLAKIFSVHKTAIYYIQKNKVWKHVVI